MDKEPYPKASLSNIGFEVFERMAEYQYKVLERLSRAKAALEAGNLRYAVIGGNAVGAWVASVDPSAVRATQDVDVMISRSDLPAVRESMSKSGFVYRHVAGIDLFLDGPNGRARDGVHILFAGEKVRPEYELPAPQITEIVRSEKGFFILTLEALVRMKLTSYRLKDQVHLQDMTGVGLIDFSWLDERYPPSLQERLKAILDNPEA